NRAGGSGGMGLGLSSGSTVVFRETIDQNSAVADGGGIYLDNGQLHVTDSTLSRNTSQSGAGMMQVGGRLWFTGSTAWGNRAGSLGGGLFLGGRAELLNSTLSG